MVDQDQIESFHLAISELEHMMLVLQELKVSLITRRTVYNEEKVFKRNSFIQILGTV